MFLDSHNYAECSGCTACASVCSKHAIAFSEVHNGFTFPVVDTTKCINCNRCRKVCAFVDKPKSEQQLGIYYGWNTDKDIRMNSTSGGAFSAIIDTFFDIYGEENACVFGAAWDGAGTVAHKMAETRDESQIFRCSKYVQSDMAGIMKTVKSQLDDGKRVLFSGTPCQVAALNSFLGEKERENLLTVDIVCNGAASPIVFKDYIDSLNEGNHKVVRYAFRNKVIEKNSQKYVSIEYDNGKRKITESDIFYVAYQLRLLHRDSCFSCPYSEEPHSSDITIGDFWHIEDKIQELKGERIKGISLVMCNSEKGLEYISQLKGMNLNATDIVPRVQKLTVDMRDKKVDKFFSNYEAKKVSCELKKYIGFKRYLRCKYYRQYGKYVNLKCKLLAREMNE